MSQVKLRVRKGTPAPIITEDTVNEFIDCLFEAICSLPPEKLPPRLRKIREEADAKVARARLKPPKKRPR